MSMKGNCAHGNYGYAATWLGESTRISTTPLSGSQRRSQCGEKATRVIRSSSGGKTGRLRTKESAGRSKKSWDILEILTRRTCTLMNTLPNELLIVVQANRQRSGSLA